MTFCTSTLLNKSRPCVFQLTYACGSRAADLSQIRVIMTKDTAFRQVSERVEVLVPRAKIVAIADISTSGAAMQAAEDPEVGAICSPFAAELYGVAVLQARLQGAETLITTFGLFWNHVGPLPIPAERLREWNSIIRGANLYGRRFEFLRR
jgi:prephenate dehydratase